MSRWHKFDFPDLPENAFQHVGDKRIKPQGGGGGGSYYSNLDKLYGMQADQSQQLMDLANSKVYPAFGELGNEARDTGSLANRENAAATSAADSAAARDQGRQALIDTMSSYGINPGDATFQRNLARNDIASAASDAAGRTGARVQQDQLGFARLKDFTSLGMGVPSAATDAANAAGNSASRSGTLQMQNAQMQSNAAGSAVRGGIDLYGLIGHKDGGLIEPIRLNGGGYVQRLAGGGVVGTMHGIAPPAPPPSAPAQANTANQVVGAAAPGVIKYGQGAVNSMAGNGASQYALTAPSGGLNATQMATQQVNSSLGNIGTSNAAAGATDYSLGSGSLASAGGAGTGAAGAATDAGSMYALDAGGAALGGAGAGAAGAAGAGAMATIGAAMPYVGAAMLVGSALGLFKDGGHVTPGTNGEMGGRVSGPGGPKDDLIPAMLSDGEFVLPVGAVKKFGLDRLEKMRQAGLDFEKQLGITK